MKQDKPNELVEMIFTVSRLMKNEMSFTTNVIHLSILQIQTLFFLNHHKHEHISMSEIASYFSIELPSATSLLNKLYDLHLVERHADPQDRRLVLISLTDDGKKFLELRSERIETKDTHGTGCTLSAALATELARGLPLHDAARRAKAFVAEALRNSLRLGKGRGPTDPLAAAQALAD